MPAALLPTPDLAPPRRRLVMPAHRTAPNETLVVATPFFLRNGATPAPAAPPLLSFDGDTFIDDFFASVADAGKRPLLLPWRDWAEPPQGMLAADGSARYPTSIARVAPSADSIERDPSVGTADGVPASVPPWLRKLYLPLHLRFTLVAFDVVCARPGFPRLGKARVLAAGAVVRRLRAGPAAPWEDWVSTDRKRGIWITLAQPIETLDPEALAGFAYAGIETAVRARLGLAAAAALPDALDSARLAVLPPDAGNGEAAEHCTFYGYVPVFSAAEQATDLAATGAAGLSTDLQAKALAAMQAVAATAPALRDRVRPALASLLALTAVAARPAAADVANAWNAVGGFVSGTFGVTGGLADAQAAVDGVLRALLLQGWAVLAPNESGNGDAELADGAAPESVATWLDRAQQALRAAASGGGGLTGAWTRESFVARTGAWRTLLDNRLSDLAEATLAGSTVANPAPSVAASLDDADRALLLACATLRLRRLRMAVVVSLRGQMFGDAEKASLVAQRNGVPSCTAGGLGQEIAGSLGLEAWRGTPDAPAWPPLATDAPNGSGSAAAVQAHSAASALEDAFAAFEAAAAEAGSVFETEQDSRLEAANKLLLGRLGLVDPTGEPYLRLRQQGLELREQPARGLFALPGPAPDGARLAAAAATVATRFDTATALATARDTARVPRLRYDHDSLYAIWGWVRVAGRDPCEKPQLLWTQRTEPFSLAEPTDVLGAKPVTIQLPDIPRLIRDIPRMAKARARPFAAFAAPPNSSYITGDDPKDTQRAWGIGWICSFGIPVITICAYILFSIIFSILIILPGFAWMLLLKFCLPIPVPKKS